LATNFSLRPFFFLKLASEGVTESIDAPLGSQLGNS
jgi:hypothetical protein